MTVALDRSLTRKSRDVGELFSIIDADGNGVIDKDEFNFAMSRVGLDQLDGLRESLSRNELSRTRSMVFDREGTRLPASVQYGDADAGDHAVASEEEYKEVGWGQTLAHRFQVTLEVMVSKIFPAGFGWQGASVLAEGWGMAADSASFALTTGVGDGLGVVTGHTLFMIAKKAATGNENISVPIEFQTGILLGSAAFCSGTAWQPVVDALTATGYGFNTAAAGTTVACALAFYGGLRLARAVYPGLGLRGIEPPSYANLKADATLSISIGGATGAFVGTDCSFGDQNWLRPVVGIEDGTGDLAGMATAGASTALGFAVFQGLQNTSFARGKSWVD